MLLSIHCDSAVTPRPASGVTTYFHRGSTRSHLLARAVQHRLVKAARTRNRGVQPDTRRYRRGFYMLRRARRPAALIELGYISHRPTARRLIQPHYRQRLASGIAAGVVDYLHRTRNR
jgi:N-acetylmuramoyl-L-alanine amidase